MSAYEDIERLSQERKRDALMVTADLGKANGLRAGAEIIRAIVKGRKMIGAGELLGAAETMEAAAAKMDAKADAAMKALKT